MILKTQNVKFSPRGGFSQIASHISTSGNTHVLSNTSDVDLTIPHCNLCPKIYPLQYNFQHEDQNWDTDLFNFSVTADS